MTSIIFASLFGIMAAIAGIPWFVMAPIVIVARPRNSVQATKIIL